MGARAGRPGSPSWPCAPPPSPASASQFSFSALKLLPVHCHPISSSLTRWSASPRQLLPKTSSWPTPTTAPSSGTADGTGEQVCTRQKRGNALKERSSGRELAVLEEPADRTGRVFYSETDKNIIVFS